MKDHQKAANDVVDALAQMTGAKAHLGLVGQRDMEKVLDAIFKIEEASRLKCKGRTK